MEEIKKCCICQNEINNVYEIKFKGLIGLQENYIEKVGYCSKCEFLFNSIPFSEKQLEERYKYLSKYEFDKQDSNFVEKKDFIKRSMVQKKFIEENCEKFNSVFEIGAASGYNLSLYKNEGKDVFGIEPSSTNKKIAFENYGVELYDNTFQQYLKEDKRKNKYDLIFLSNVLEHIVNPMECIENLKKYSNKYIFIEVPTFDYKISDEVFGMFSDEHVNYFSFKSLQNMMNKAGYHILNARIEFYLQCYVPSGTPSLMTIWEKDKENVKYEPKEIIGETITKFQEYINDSEKKIYKIKEKIKLISDDEKIAIWGTGNHTARILAMTDLKNKNIIKFYDSDVKKHNYKIMGKEITSFDINDILNNKIDKIVISTYVSQKSIVDSIKVLIPENKIIYFYDDIK